VIVTLKERLLMKSEAKNGKNWKDHATVAVSGKALSQNEPEKTGVLKRFLEWLIRGAAKSHLNGTSCPT
jgi:hypothetical protein